MSLFRKAKIRVAAKEKKRPLLLPAEKTLKGKKMNAMRAQGGSNQEEMHHTKIRVIGIGGGGGNIIAEIAPKVPRIEFWVANTDMQALKRIGKACRRFAFGQNFTQGLGCGGNAKIGTAAAKHAEEKISRLFQGVDFCILVSCLGGGTGSGAVSVFAELAKKANCLTLGVFTLPFRFEGEKRMQTAKLALAKTIPFLSASVIFPNEKIFQLLDKGAGFQSALSQVNTMLAQDLKNLMDVIYSPGLVNIDFADLRSVLEGEGRFAYLASAEVQDDASSRAESVVKALLSHPLNEYNPRGAERILLNIAADKELSIAEVQSISSMICALNPQAKMIFGVSHPPKAKKAIILTLLAVGRSESDAKKKRGAKKEGRERKLLKPKGNALPSEIPGKEKVPAKQSPLAAKISPKATAAQLRPVQKKLSTSTQVARGAKKKKERVKKDGKATGRYVQEQIQVKIRKNALDLQKEIELAAKKQEEEERKWDIPAFLRKNIIS